MLLIWWQKLIIFKEWNDFFNKSWSFFKNEMISLLLICCFFGFDWRVCSFKMWGFHSVYQFVYNSSASGWKQLLQVTLIVTRILFELRSSWSYYGPPSVKFESWICLFIGKFPSSYCFKWKFGILPHLMMTNT